VNITFVLSSNSTLQTADVAAAAVSYNNYHIPTLRFNVIHQLAYGALPSHLQLIHRQKLNEYVPTIAILKAYGSNYHSKEPEYYVLYFHHLQKEINIAVDLTSENHCPLVQTLWHLLQANETSG
jgi:hypothetical protein